MRTILMIIWANIKSKKVQSIALCLVFISVSILFFLSIRLFGTVGDYDKLFVESKASQSLIFVNNETTKDIIIDFLEEKDEISNINILSNFDNVIEANVLHEGTTIPIQEAFFTEHSTNEFDQIKIIEGKTVDQLLDDEVIFSYGKSQLNKIKVGDTLVVNTDQGTKEMIIAGIGVDLTFNFDTITLNRFWTTKGTIESLENDIKEYSVGISYFNYTQESEQKILDDLNSLLGDRATDTTVISYSIILEANSFFQVVMGAIFTIIGAILIIVGLYIVRSIIYNNILTDSKKIATLKSTGFSSNNIISIYLVEYGVIAIVSIIIGIFGSFLLSDIVLGDLKELSNIFGLSNNINISQMAIVFIIILLVIELTVFLVSRGVSKVNPAIAISRGEHVYETKSVVSLTKYQKLPISLVLAFKDMFYNKRMVITLFLFSIAVTFTIVALSSTSFSLNSQKDNLQLWMGYDIDANIVSSVPLDLESHEDIITKLEGSEYVEGTLTKFLDMNSQIFDDNNGKYITSISEIYVTGSKEVINFNILDGRVPDNENEIMVAHNMLVSLDKELGDFATVRSLGEEKVLLIVGEYQSFTNQGMTFRIFLDNIPDEFLNNSSIQVNLIPDVKSDIVSDEISSLFDSNISLVYEYPNASMISMFDILSIVTTGIIAIFAVICLVVLLNFNLTNANKERFNYGIYKSVGMDDQTIINIYLFKNTIINIFGVLIGGILGMLSLPKIMNTMTGSLGINEFPTNINHTSVLISFAIMFSVTCINALIIKHNVSTITPKELLVE